MTDEKDRMVPREVPPGDLRARYEWKKVEAPKRWNPRANGEELTGFYGGKTTRNGKFGQYDVVLVTVPRRGVFMISGTRIVQLADASGVDVGWPVRIVWRGTVKLDKSEDGEDRNMKMFDFFVAEGDPVSPEDMPRIKGQDEGRRDA
jgi:hypothetical protein